ncbi:MAG: hypothetical protein APF84_01705 [Gracilibacter sp. BRH_c7a]|nr:MAG: hypothetical protein APF84_01705 [Gracilibacter sp. BRH_c7a]
MRGGSLSQESDYIRIEKQGVTLYVDKRILPKEKNKVITISTSGFGFFTTFEIDNARCAWPGEEENLNDQQTKGA